MGTVSNSTKVILKNVRGIYSPSEVYAFKQMPRKTSEDLLHGLIYSNYLKDKKFDNSRDEKAIIQNVISQFLS